MFPCLNGRFTIIVAAILLVGASGLVWSQSRSVGPDAATAITASSPISPIDLMIDGSGTLPIERWDAF
jgi:hypothetical protein